MPDPVTVHRIPGKADDPLLMAAYALRHYVFVLGQDVPEELERDGLDESAWHAVAVSADGRVVGAGRVLVEDGAGRGRAGRVGRMAVAAAGRGAGVGRLLLAELERAARDAGADRIELHAQASAIGFYDRTGYAPVGERYTEAGIEHLTMVKALPVRRPVRDDDSAALIDLIGTTWAEYPGCVLDIDGEEPWLRAPAAAYEQKGGPFWVVELAGTVVACGGLVPHGEEGELKSLYVSAKARRRGLGAELVAAVEKAAAERGITVLRLWTDSRFADAHRLYARLGYEPTGATRDLHDLSDTTEYEYVKALG